MTLHDAIVYVLGKEGRPVTAAEILQRVVAQSLYRGKDGEPPTLQQIYARISNYPNLFVVHREHHPHTFELRSESTQPPAVAEPRPVPAAGIHEEAVQDVLAAHLRAEGWVVRKMADTKALEEGARCRGRA